MSLPGKLIPTAALARHAVSLVQDKAREQGWPATLKKLAAAPFRHGAWTLGRHVRAGYIASRPKPPRQYPIYDSASTRPASAFLQPRVLLVAELSLAQCRKYRVTQKADHLRSLGVPCTVLDWGDRRSVRNALQTHAVVIFYRVPGYPDVLEIINEAKRLGVTTFWEVDDLIFDAEAYDGNGNLHLLDPELKQGILFGIPLYRAALQRCDFGIASTESLAEGMRQAGVDEAFVIENALDPETMSLAEKVRAARSRSGATVTIVYGSGSKAHDADFATVACAVHAVMRQREGVRLRIVGHLTLPDDFAEFGGRVERAPFGTFEAYLAQLGSADISIAPLEPTLFNEAKSNIKFLEASVLELPSVCSPRSAFRSVIQNGVNGFLAETEDQWTAALLKLVDSPDERARMSRAAAESARREYQPAPIAQRQVAPLLSRFLPARAPALRVLVANIFFRPQTFGGATVVAEELASRLGRRSEVEVAVFTSYAEDAAPYELFRYDSQGIPVFAAKVPAEPARELEYVNPRMGELFAEVLEAVRPDVVHLHSIQWLSASLADACRAAAIPYVITLHDAWWLCERQFMVNGEGKYCLQTALDPAVCARCVADSWFTSHRNRQLRRVLDEAALLLTPSEFHRQLHIANGVRPDRIQVNRNGVRPGGKAPVRRLDPNRVRFGFVGGIGPIKGIDLIRRAFEDIDAPNYELRLVDNTLNLGYSSVAAEEWKVAGKVTTIPAYTQDSMDEFFASIDVLLFPSQWKESFGLTVREALIRDVWVILTDSGGAVEDVVDGENGTIIPITDDEAPLRTAILDILQHPARLDGYSNPHKRRISTFDAQADELHQVLLAISGSRLKGEGRDSGQRRSMAPAI
jgi:glycosyltransferase involved in cell wall biosynthesis